LLTGTGTKKILREREQKKFTGTGTKKIYGNGNKKNRSRRTLQGRNNIGRKRTFKNKTIKRVT
jgi:hypothetical protein